MRKQVLYFIIETILSLIVLSLFIIYICIDFNILIALLALIGSFYFINKAVIGFKLFIDIVEGPKEKCTVFMGNSGIEHLDFFYKIYFANIYFDDEELVKNYLVFDNVFGEGLCPGDRVMVTYYKRSRIVIMWEKCCR